MGEKKWELRVSKVHFCNTGVSAGHLDWPCRQGNSPRRLSLPPATFSHKRATAEHSLTLFK